ncbi:MAG TPA: DUF4097 family beta strand repeat protein [Firmicutes bacterium]|jgi:DUF4097 and DUF4098 domain-containing protein YvlB|nr:DUF4097 family beta strand repeat-containing protein [Bacillota bacterium]HHT42994.1 DUF4097 family beta strand repeat protein [Bacillota bacterium]
MQQERRMILRMLEEGKITAEEAEALLNALGDGEGSTESEPQEDPWVRVEKMGEDFASKVEVAVERFSRSLEHNVSDKLTKLPKILAKFPFLGFEESQEFTQVVRGPVAAGDVISIDLSNVNGPLRLQGWSEDYYQLTLVQRLKGRDRELLRSRLYEVDWADNALMTEFKLDIPSFMDRTISVHLMVPEGRTYAVTLMSQNGSLRVENLKGTTVSLESINGSVELRSVQARSIEGTAHNGACEMDGVEAEEIRHELGNGSYRMSVSARVLDLVTTNGTINLRVPEVQGSSSYRLRTTNGSVNVSLPARMDLGAALNLQTSVGRVSAELGSLEITHHERQGGGAVLQARSHNYDSLADKVDLEATCVSGSITVSA